MATFWIGTGLGWPERDFGVVIALCHVGAHFEALDMLCQTHHPVVRATDKVDALEIQIHHRDPGSAKIPNLGS